jgi:diguanylate cyclase (GGDEF)-like protein/PAS domain S-box-containing protein
MSKLAQNESPSGPESVRSERTLFHRQRLLRVLFVHREAEAIESCLRELEKGQFTVKSDIVLNLTECKQQLRNQSYDVVVLEYPPPHCKASQAKRSLQEAMRETTAIFLTNGSTGESMANLRVQCVFDYVERDHLATLPMAVRRALKEKALREELEQARKALQHSQSSYRALMDNPAYGIYQCDAVGRLLEANQALATMLGYESAEQLLAANQESAIIPDLHPGAALKGHSSERAQIEPLEIDWKRKDRTTLKVRLSGRDMYDARGKFAGQKVIAVDITEQRTLEDQLRRQALSDSLTGLANHRHLFEVLHAEICRSKRTEREFSLVMLDLDGLKEINDRFGHLTGNRALCRLAQILADCCRSVDTAARHGGDEFAVVLPETGLPEAILVARRICELLEEDMEEPPLSVSVGAATYPSGADSVAGLLYAADRDLYVMKSKRSCRLRVANAASGS